MSPPSFRNVWEDTSFKIVGVFGIWSPKQCRDSVIQHPGQRFQTAPPPLLMMCKLRGSYTQRSLASQNHCRCHYSCQPCNRSKTPPVNHCAQGSRPFHPPLILSKMCPQFPLRLSKGTLPFKQCVWNVA